MQDVSSGEAEVNRWYHQHIEDLMAEHDCTTPWGIPRDVFHAAQAEYTKRMREVFGRDPDSGEKTPQRKKAERAVPEDDDDELDRYLRPDDDGFKAVMSRASHRVAEIQRRQEGMAKVQTILDERFPGI
jgi:hypothetical protein